MRPRVPRRLWDALRVASVAGALGLVVGLVVAPGRALPLMWDVVVPVLPLLFFLAPGFWRNVCPLAATNQVPRRFGFTRGLTAPRLLQRHGYLVAVGLFLAAVPARKVLFDESGLATAGLLLGALGFAFVGGFLLKGKSGWCSSICPLLPVQRIYGQTPFAGVRNSHCEPCVGCTKNCYDFNPRVAQLADLYDSDQRHAGYRKLFAGALPGLVLAFFVLDPASGWDIARLYGIFGLFVLAGAGTFAVIQALLGISEHRLAAVYGAIALNLFYWFSGPPLLVELRIPGAEPAARGASAALLTLTGLWIWRTFTKETRFLEEVSAAPSIRLGAGAEGALAAAQSSNRPEVTLLPEDRRVAVQVGETVLEIAERSDVPLEAGCRMGVCGSDPVCIVAGDENLSPPSAEERGTLERLGLQDGHRMACSARVLGPVSISLELNAGEQPRAPLVGAEEIDPSVRRLVVVGNGIAGVTAADYARRAHPDCAIDIVARERHPLYNRMAITRLIYGRSAMQGLYLLPHSWYEQNRITSWLNAKAERIDRERKEVVLATGERLEYDRLILADGSESFVPDIEGFGCPGSFVLREAEDAMAIRSYVQDRHARRAVVAGGGLLGLEAAYALHKNGERVTVLSRGRLLDKQLDERGAQFLRRYLEGLGLEIDTPAEAVALQANGQLRAVLLSDGRSIPADIFVVCAGIRPSVQLAGDAGLAVGRAVVVDERMRTSDPCLLAAGDAAEYRGAVLGLWPVAVEQGKVAGVNAVGGDARYEPSAPATMLKVTGVELTSAGHIAAEPGELEIALEDSAGSRYRKLVLAADGTLLGAILLGYPHEAYGVIAAVKEHRNLTPWVDALRSGDWSVFRDSAAKAATAVA